MGRLDGKVALISRGINSFAEKIELATEAGARMAIIANHPEDNVGLIMGETDYAQIPSMLIRGEDGVALRNYMATNGPVEVRTLLLAAQYRTNVTASLLCEHVAVRVQQFTSSRGNLRITVTSPSGTRSVLQDLSNDFNGGPTDWTYYSTHHFFESSQGTWTVQFSDEIA